MTISTALRSAFLLNEDDKPIVSGSNHAFRLTTNPLRRDLESLMFSVAAARA